MRDPTDIPSKVTPYEWLRRGVVIYGRYGVATLGPVSVSASHFVASFALLRILSALDFGLFSFGFIVVQFCFGISNALVATPFTVAANRRDFRDENAAVFFKANLLFSLSAGCVCGGILYFMHAGEVALLFGLFCTTATLRWFARAHAYALHAPFRVVVSDLVYASVLLGGGFLGWLTYDLTIISALAAFIAAAIAGLAVSGLDFLGAQFRNALSGHLSAYLSIWRDQSRWMLLGIASTEATANAHAYLVTIIAGPAAFAPLAAGALFMRPVLLCANSLTQLERPAMIRAVASGGSIKHSSVVSHFKIAMMSVWLAAVSLSAFVLIYSPSIILKSSYDLTTVMESAAIWAAVVGVQAWRVPDSALLQAVGRFRSLADASVYSSVVAIISVFSLLVFFGPVVSLGGVFLGQSILAWRISKIKNALGD